MPIPYAIPDPVGTLVGPPEPVTGNGWEIYAVSPADYHTVLANIARPTQWSFAKLLNDKGSVSVTINHDDVLFSNTLGDGSAGSNLRDEECLWQYWLNGTCVMDGLGETVTEQLVDSSEQRLDTISGPGTAQVLTWALVMPPGFPDVVFKTDAIYDDFSEVDVNGNPLLDTSLWNLSSPLDDITLNPLGTTAINLDYSDANPYGAIIGTCQLTASSGGTFLGAGPYDITNSVISAQMAPMAPGTGLDGSQVTQMYVQSTANSSYYAMIGLSSTEFYCQLGDTTGVSTKVLGTYDATNDAYWMITEIGGYFYFWTSADGESWTQEWVVPHHFDASHINVFFSAVYDAGGAVVGITNLNQNVTTPTNVGSIYIEVPIVSTWVYNFNKAQARGTIGWVTTRMNSVQDSFGNPWTDLQSAQMQNGTDLYTLLQSVTSIVDADFRMQPGFNLQVGLPLSGTFGSGVSLGENYEYTIVFHEGDQITQRGRTRARDQIANLIGAQNEDYTVVVAEDSDSVTEWGQREGWITTGQQITPAGMLIVADASVASTGDESVQWTCSVNWQKAGCVPLQDFDVGDWVGMEDPDELGTIDAVRVVGVAYSSDQDGVITCELTLESYRQWLQEQLQYLVNKFGGNFINAQGATILTAVPVQQTGLPFVINPDLGGLADVTIS